MYFYFFASVGSCKILVKFLQVHIENATYYLTLLSKHEGEDRTRWYSFYISFISLTTAIIVSAEELDGGEYLFAFRMLMVLFRREFSFVDSLYLWEVRSYFFSIYYCYIYSSDLVDNEVGKES